MLPVFLLSLGLIAIIMTIMAVGVIFSNKELKGSCGGPGNCECERKGIPKKCEQVANQILESINETP
ncbi:MAG: DUF539 domain-containing protein [Deltaproteobacteria bacterium]|nr:DUF539 domain-containing protein [Deltaproteobacteria bacterium]MBU51066.1 DUF539 domain-containing protein [Deltaproteobacteria bacterium]|tara:strand:+ start:5614 stop:5814 length:201 start_codon:yes stop_codon:yes gene_type:complete